MPEKQDGNELIGTKNLPAGYTVRLAKAREGRAYTELSPYPLFGKFREWKEDERGPLPICWPLTVDVLKESSDWLFGREIKFKVTIDDADTESEKTQKTVDAITKFLHDVWEENKMPTEMLQASLKAGYEGGTVLSWSWPDESEEEVLLFTYSVATQTRLYYDSHDDDCLIMARVQYIFHDATEDSASGSGVKNPRGGKWFVHREDWTVDRHIVYEPQEIPTVAVSGNLGHGDPSAWVWSGGVDWAFLEQFDPAKRLLEEDNAAGVIPLREIVHIDTGKPYGEGDLWRMYRHVDEYNHTRQLANVDNQISVDPHTIYIDLKPQDGEEPKSDAPKASEALESIGDKQGKVEQIDNAAQSRDAIDSHAETLERDIRATAGYPRLDVDKITNKGNLTLQVMRLVFAPQIQTTENKRRQYGEYGIAPFLESMLEGLKNAQHPVAKKFPDGVQVEVVWPSFFDVTVEELRQNTDLQQLLIEQGFTTKDRAILALASLMQVDDVVALAKELKEIEDAEETDEQDDDGNDANSGNGTGNGTRGD